MQKFLVSLVAAVALCAAPAFAQLSTSKPAPTPVPIPTTPAGAVKVDGSAATQPVSGTVNVGNFPATQPATQSGAWTVQPGNTVNTNPWLVALCNLAGSKCATFDTSSYLQVVAAQGGAWTVAVSNFPSSFAVSSLPALPTGTNAIGSVTVSNFPTTQAVSWSGQSVGVSSLPALSSGSNIIGSTGTTTTPNVTTISQGGNAATVAANGGLAVRIADGSGGFNYVNTGNYNSGDGLTANGTQLGTSGFNLAFNDARGTWDRLRDDTNHNLLTQHPAYTATANVTVPGAYDALTLSGEESSCVATLSGTFSGFAATLQGSADGTNYNTVAYVGATGGQASSTLGVVGTYFFNVASLQAVKVSVTAITSGTATIAISCGNAPIGLIGGSVIIAQGGTQAAVTAGNALKVDNSAVTQPVSGSVSLNGGTNVIGSVGSTTTPNVSNVYQVGGTTLGAPTAAGTSASGNLLGVQGVTGGVPVAITADPATATYTASLTALAGVSGVNVTLTGSATKTVRLRRVIVSGYAGTAAAFDATLTKYSTAASGGTAVTAPTIATMDSSDAAASATVKGYSAAPTAGTAAGIVRAWVQQLLASTTYMIPNEFDFAGMGDKAPSLHGTAEQLGLTLSAAPTTGHINVTLEWTEQ